MPTRSNTGNTGETGRDHPDPHFLDFRYLLRVQRKMLTQNATTCIAGDEQLLVSWNRELVQARFIATDWPFDSHHLPMPAAIQLQASPFQTFTDEGADFW